MTRRRRTLPVRSPLAFEGDVLDGAYRIESIERRGRDATRVRAYEEREGRWCTLILASARDSSVAAGERIQRLHALSRSVQAPQILRVERCGVTDTLAYAVAEDLRGRDLESFANDDAGRSPEMAVSVILHAIEGLAALHGAGFVHGSLRPSAFVWVDATETRLVLVDLAPVRKLPSAPPPARVTRPAAVRRANARFRPPESLADPDDLDARADIYCLCGLLEHLLEGRSGESAALPEGLRAVLDRGRARDRARRYADLGELTDALVPFSPADCRDVPQRVRERLDSGPSPPEEPARVHDVAPKGAEAPRRRPSRSQSRSRSRSQSRAVGASVAKRSRGRAEPAPEPVREETVVLPLHRPRRRLAAGILLAVLGSIAVGLVGMRSTEKAPSLADQVPGAVSPIEGSGAPAAHAAAPDAGPAPPSDPPDVPRKAKSSPKAKPPQPSVAVHGSVTSPAGPKAAPASSASYIDELFGSRE